ncbi:NAD(P)/FAD-dependent oxidoreductase [Saccharothrix sp. S26]|uniref:flavin-containing monooxygenase n=1 Tax=Saccharothrix sp. S26 TaxID=2907215 RepID=UPI001F43789F|nr:NAD(P)/FAD-dependent oxidoreductase [Saccharothrix sp. S26]MCE6995475.1 NAD(P)/FAD-dependent oxidoreductase [Saccharothrix sp. S26]
MVEVVVIGGGQSGLAAAYAVKVAGGSPVVMEAGERSTGSWAGYYDSLRLFSPARYSALPGLAFGGDPDRYPRRDEVVAYLARYAEWLGVEIRTGQRVEKIVAGAGGFEVAVAGGERVSARRVIAATGGFGAPYRPALPGLDRFAGSVVHAAEYRIPEPYAGKRVVVVGAGNSAVQIAHELASEARVTLSSRKPVRFVKQRPLGRDVHWWWSVTGVDRAPVGRWLPKQFSTPVLDGGTYRAAIAAGRPDRRPMFTDLDGDMVTWSDGGRERVDALILATGYRPGLGYLEAMGALDVEGFARHRSGLSTTHPGLGFVGLEWQRSLSSATLRGVGRDARYVVRRLGR